MNWNKLTDTHQLENIKAESIHQPILLFKHSTRCSISATSLRRLERDWNADKVATLKPYYVDLIAHREVSNQIAKEFDVQHESPQVLIIKDGKSVYDASHYDIDFEAITAQV